MGWFGLGQVWRKAYPEENKIETKHSFPVKRFDPYRLLFPVRVEYKRHP